MEGKQRLSLEEISAQDVVTLAEPKYLEPWGITQLEKGRL